jgi:hypothetical protein
MATMNARWWFAYSMLLLTIHEAHELAHCITARLLCGAWPARDFNAWRLVGTCYAIAPTAAGPLFSYAVMFIGIVIALRSEALSTAGIALLLAANPFARIFTAAMGGGDEMGIARHFAVPRVIAFIIVALICGTPIVIAYRIGTQRITVFIAIMLWPMVLTGTLLFLIGNRLLLAGVLNEPVIAGAPLLVIIVTVMAFILTTLTAKSLRTL